MLRLPTQFDPCGQSTPSAAGGGSTSTTCSSCVVTLIAGAAVPAAHFARLAGMGQPTVALAQPETAVAEAGSAPAQSPARVVPDASGRLSNTAAILMGLSLPVVTLLLLGVTSMVGGAGMLLGLVLAAIYSILMFRHVYERTRGEPGKGVGLGVLYLVLMLVAACVEMYLWMSTL